MEGNTIYTLTYDANGGEGGPGVITKNGNENYVIFSVNDVTPVRPGFVFSGWSFSSDGEPQLLGGDYFTVMSRETTLYAIWTEAQEVVSEEAYSENTEPLGVFTSNDSPREVQIMGDAIGFSFIGAAIILGLIGLLLFRKRQPRILSQEEVDISKEDN